MCRQPRHLKLLVELRLDFAEFFLERLDVVLKGADALGALRRLRLELVVDDVFKVVQRASDFLHRISSGLKKIRQFGSEEDVQEKKGGRT